MPKPLNKIEAANRIGVSLRTLNRMLSARRAGRNTACPPWSQIGHRVLFDPVDVDAWLQMRKCILHPTTLEMSKDVPQ